MLFFPFTISDCCWLSHLYLSIVDYVRNPHDIILGVRCRIFHGRHPASHADKYEALRVEQPPAQQHQSYWLLSHVGQSSSSADDKCGGVFRMFVAHYRLFLVRVFAYLFGVGFPSADTHRWPTRRASHMRGSNPRRHP